MKIKSWFFKISLGTLLLGGILLSGAGKSFAQGPDSGELLLPDVLGVGLDGKPFNIKELLGKENVYLVFWTTWCGVCRQEIPNLIQTYQNVKDIRFIAINPGINDSLDRTRHYQEKFKLPYPIVFDESGTSAQIFGIVGVPTAIIINKNKEVIYAGFPPPSSEVANIFKETPEQKK